ncbi:MAG: hypothetical protein WDA53_02390 [Bacillota bacterium]
MVDNKEKTILEQTKTALLEELYFNTQEKSQAIKEQNLERLTQLLEKANDLMARIDVVNGRLQTITDVLYGGKFSPEYLNSEQKQMLIETRALHREITSELIKQRSAVVAQMQELREIESVMGVYNKEPVSEGAFLDQKK